jgi:hypothetical protein
MSDEHKVIQMPYAPMQLDDTRLRAAWTTDSQNRRRRDLLLLGALVLMGLAAVVAASAVVVWAWRLQPPVVNVAPPTVNVAPPTVNVAPPEVKVEPKIDVHVPPPPSTAPVLPQAPAPKREGKVVTDYTIFHHQMVDGGDLQTGWTYRHSTDTRPSLQYCLVRLGRTGWLSLADDHVPNPYLANDAKALGVDEKRARDWLTRCVWFD